MSDSSSQTTKKQNSSTILESLKKVGSSSAKSLNENLIKPTSKDFMQQILGVRLPKRSGEISAGESVEMDDVLSGQHQENVRLKKQVAMERKLRQEESSLVETKSNELRVELHALTQEIQKLVASTQEISQEVKIASFQAPIEPGIYHLIFFQKLLEFIKSFRKKIEDSSVWLNGTNTRASQKDYWQKYEKHGSKFLLSADHYLTRSAG